MDDIIIDIDDILLVYTQHVLYCTTCALDTVY